MPEYSVEYAKSNRSTCKGCKVKIDKDTLRIGVSVEGDGDYMMTSWRHLACIMKPNALGSLDYLAGYGSLRPVDAALVRDWFDKKMDVVAAAKRQADVDSALLAASSPASTPKKAKVASKLPATPPSFGASSASSSSAGTPSTAQTSDEIGKIDVANALFCTLSIDALKQCLRANDQLLSGNKADLVERCVDRKVYGNLPRCPQCGIGRLKCSYSRKYGHSGNGLFTCPGGYDDDEYKRCSYRSATAVRPAWVVTEHEVAAPKSPRKSAGGAVAAAFKSGGGVAAATFKSGGGAAAAAFKSGGGAAATSAMGGASASAAAASQPVVKSEPAVSVKSEPTMSVKSELAVSVKSEPAVSVKSEMPAVSVKSEMPAARLPGPDE